MITPMFKYSFLVFYADYENFIKELKDMGAAHINEFRQEPSKEMQELYRTISDVHKTIKTLKKRDPDQKNIKGSFQEKSGKKIYETVEKLEKELDRINQSLTALEKERKLLQPWGYFSLDKLNRLKDKGFSFQFLVCPVKKFQDQWVEKHPIEIISDLRGYRYFVAVQHENDTEHFPQIKAVDKLSPPGKEFTRIEKEIEENKEKLRDIHAKLDRISLEGL
ncbi:MAG: hypothetical protein R6U19_02980, partial [Bacteroidales bacterium]